ncbi:hypothetical protein [Sphingomonas sp. BK345]|uniref:hypothetical protein n=1 Tax=Sphingomonas sp. BK345 TaxID=2586980 RepID=UPI00161EE3A9|nr:hypothetical protein [Sphingomonas sp. BK345]MBB3473540.1 hypothetical protein [Sphingomonas sp. BK345]
MTRLVHHLNRAHPSATSDCSGRVVQLIGLLRVIIPFLLRVTPEEVEMLLAAAAQMRARHAIWCKTNTMGTQY